MRNNVPSINPLDSYAKEHDIRSSQTTDDQERAEADQILKKQAWTRVLAKDSSPKEKVAALVTVEAMKLEKKLGGRAGKPKKKCRKRGGGLTFSQLLSKARKSV